MVREPTHSEENKRYNQAGKSEAEVPWIVNEGSWVQSKSNERDEVSPVNQRKWQKGKGKKRPQSSVRTSFPARHDEPIYGPLRLGHHAQDKVEGRIKV